MSRRIMPSFVSTRMRRGIMASCLPLPLVLMLSLTACAGSTPPPISTPDQSSPPATSPDQPSSPSPEPAPPSTPKPSGPIEAIWIEPQINGDTVSIPVSQIVDNWNTHFKLRAEVNGKNAEINFMALLLDEEIHVRSNLCPPCRSVGFALENNILICNTCRTTFNAKTGDGIKGACVDFPKASVSYEIADDQLVMNVADLIAAYEDTLKPGWP